MFGKKEESVNYWMSYTDLLAGSLVIFVMITVVLVIKVRAEFEGVSNSQEKLNQTLMESFGGGQLEGVRVTPEGVITFLDGGDSLVLFRSGSDEPTRYFKQHLNQVLPVILTQVDSILNKNKYANATIKAIKVDGHTSSIGNYYYNLELSQGRARNIHKYIMAYVAVHKRYSASFGRKIRSHLITTGYGEQKLLDSSGIAVEISGNTEDVNRSRRVELQIELGKRK